MLAFVLLTAFLFIGSDCAEEWSYSGDNGPGHWPDIDGASCGSKIQSPIDIKTKDVMAEEFVDWKLDGYSLDDTDGGTATSVENNGHSLTVHLEGNYIMSGGGLDGNYKAVQFHFHWGSTDNQGSEHTVDQQSYAAEMHIVHYNNSYDDFSAAVGSDDPEALAVLGVFIEIGDDNDALNEVFMLAKSVPYKDDTAAGLDGTSVADILPKDLTRFYRYSGSLTTPDCYEVVVWTMFQDPIQISANQMSVLRNLYEGHDESSTLLVDNYRPVQSLNERSVYFSSASTYNVSMLLSVICAAVLALRYI